ncbi:MFS transporter [Streptomyces sp. NPDC056669]|uniref:MFS transporter n=1 Tax=Streptomyces sp. NPDC056669 TaxID=3345903 RepID=UPI0036CEDE4B
MTTRTVSPEAPVKVHRVIVAASIGNALEWFDILVYGFFAATISKQFFPAADETVSLLLTLGTFAVAYVVRPVGALVLGAYADRAGRKRALMLSIRLMMVARSARPATTSGVTSTRPVSSSRPRTWSARR